MDHTNILGAAGGVALAYLIIREVLNFLRARGSEGGNSWRGAIELKVNTLWEVYAMDAMRMARRENLVNRQSKIYPTPKLLAIFGDMFDGIQKEIQARRGKLNGYNLAAEIWNRHNSALLQRISEREDVSAAAIFGALIALCAEQ